MSRLTVSVETPQHAEVLDLLRQSDAYSASLYPVESGKPLSLEALSAPSIQFLVARRDGVAVGCCAPIAPGDSMGELKRMVASEGARQRGVGQQPSWKSGRLRIWAVSAEPARPASTL